MCVYSVHIITLFFSGLLVLILAKEKFFSSAPVSLKFVALPFLSRGQCLISGFLPSACKTGVPVSL